MPILAVILVCRHKIKELDCVVTGWKRGGYCSDLAIEQETQTLSSPLE